MGARRAGVTQRGKGYEPFSSSKGLEFLPSCSPHLAGTCENNSPAFSHSADPIAISTLEGIRVRGNPDRQNAEREKERRVLIGLDRCRGQLSGCAILISYEGCLAAQAHRLVWFCVCVL